MLTVYNISSLYKHTTFFRILLSVVFFFGTICCYEHCEANNWKIFVLDEGKSIGDASFWQIDEDSICVDSSKAYTYFWVRYRYRWIATLDLYRMNNYTGDLESGFSWTYSMYYGYSQIGYKWSYLHKRSDIKEGSILGNLIKYIDAYKKRLGKSFYDKIIPQDKKYINDHIKEDIL